MGDREWCYCFILYWKPRETRCDFHCSLPIVVYHYTIDGYIGDTMCGQENCDIYSVIFEDDLDISITKMMN
jgi:hypothetical protein